MAESLATVVSRWLLALEQGAEFPLAELCRDCPELANELAPHLEALRRSSTRQEESRFRVKGLPGECAIPATGAPIPNPHVTESGDLAALPGFLIPGFEIQGILGKGGMGVVYQARQVRLNRVVALKMIISGEHAGIDERMRFLGEAEAIAAIKHPHIVEVYEFGTHQDHPYFALEFCPKGSLASQLEGKPLVPGVAARLVEQLARAVQAAHDKGIIHRDLKPGNVLLTEEGSPKITDFGLAKKVTGGSGLTQTGAVLGTPSYMAPEQALGRKDVGKPADVYALGAILYELLTGRPPFQAATAMETVMQVIEDEPVPPRQLQSKTPRYQEFPVSRQENGPICREDTPAASGGLFARVFGPPCVAPRLSLVLLDAL